MRRTLVTLGVTVLAVAGTAGAATAGPKFDPDLNKTSYWEAYLEATYPVTEVTCTKVEFGDGVYAVTPPASIGFLVLKAGTVHDAGLVGAYARYGPSLSDPEGDGYESSTGKELSFAIGCTGDVGGYDPYDSVPF